MNALEIDFGPLLPHHPIEMVMGFVLLVIIAIFLAKVVVPKFEEMYAERTEQIQGGIEKAERAQAEAKAALEEHQQQLNEARQEAARIREDAKNDGARIKAEMREQAEAEAQRIVSQARAQMEAERTQVVAELRSQIGGLATTLAGRIVGESLDDDERARRSVDRFIAELENDDREAAGQNVGQQV